MTMEIHVLAWNRHKMLAELNRLIGSQPPLIIGSLPTRQIETNDGLVLCIVGFGSTLQPVQILRLGSTPDNGDVFSIIPYHAATSLCGFLWYGG
jgi:hypothetical protein